MATGADNSKPTDRELADLSALADGTLDPARRAEVEAWIAASPELSARYERERRPSGRARTRPERPSAPRPRCARGSRRASRAGGPRPGGGSSTAAALAGALAVVAAGARAASSLGHPGGAVGIRSGRAGHARADRPAPAPDASDPTARLKRERRRGLLPQLGVVALGALARRG